MLKKYVQRIFDEGAVGKFTTMTRACASVSVLAAFVSAAAITHVITNKAPRTQNATPTATQNLTPQK